MGVEMTHIGIRRVAERRQRGLSLVEAVIAAGLLLVIAAGVLPLFAQALASNQSGADSSSVTNISRTQVEELYQLIFSHPQTTIVTGTELVTPSYYECALLGPPRQCEWQPGMPPVDSTEAILWTRTATIRQYSINALDDQRLEPGEALAADAPPGQVHLKEIEVEVLGTREAGPLGPSRRIAVRMLKSQ